MIPCVLYASKSSPDEKGSTSDQLEQIRRAMPQDREEIAAFKEENVSGYHGSRGQELQSAMAKAIEAAGNEVEKQGFRGRTVGLPFLPPRTRLRQEG